MALFAKDPNQIISESIDYMQSNTVINSTGPGSKFRTLLEIFKNQLSEAYTVFDYNTVVGFIYGAYGKYLDYLGDIFGLERIAATVASSHSSAVKFYTNASSFGAINNNVDIVIPTGTRVWAQRGEDKIYYSVIADSTLPKNDTSAYVNVKAVSSGSSSNVQAGTLRFFEFSNYSPTASYSLFVTNVDSIDNGSDEETDDNFRYRIINAKLHGAAANETAIRLACFNVPGVADVLITDKYAGIGTARVIIKSTTPVVSSGLLDEVQAAINNIKAAGSKVTAMAPTYIKMVFVFTVTYKSGTTDDDIVLAESLITANTADYVNNLDIEEPYYVEDLLTVLTGLHSKIKSIDIAAYIYKPVLDYSIKEEVITDYTPSVFCKLIISDINGVQFN